MEKTRVIFSTFAAVPVFRAVLIHDGRAPFLLECVVFQFPVEEFLIVNELYLFADHSDKRNN